MLSTALGAFIPLIPFFFTRGYPAVIASLAISIVAHFAVGAAKSLVTTRSWWASGLEMTIVGLIVLAHDKDAEYALAAAALSTDAAEAEVIVKALAQGPPWTAEHQRAAAAAIAALS